jgi:putative endonuclease
VDDVKAREAHYVYMVCCANGAFYTGYTRNVERRIATHNAGKGGRYTRSHRPVSLMATWTFSSRAEALQAEHEIKRLTRAQKLKLVEVATSVKGEIA